jgi:nitrite reductase/ring-hydroxylating ferredoxin subunit
VDVVGYRKASRDLRATSGGADMTELSQPADWSEVMETAAETIDGEWDLVGLPMPRNPALLDPLTPRVHVSTVEDRFPFPIPNGWFVVALAGELDGAGVVSLHYFGRDLVLYRTDSGEARLVDAYCAHLGAHLGVGGKVEGDCIRCPFHGWAYDGINGSCVEIPYGPSERIPGKAKIRSFPTIERAGAIWAWHHLLDEPPFYELPTVPEFDDPKWSPALVREFRIATTCQEMAENNHDWAHFQFVHGKESVPDGEEFVDGTYKRVRNPGLERETFGLGLGVVRVTDVLTFMSSVTPLDEGHVCVRWFFTVPDGGPMTAEDFAAEFTAGVTQDIPIWENKVYRPHPVLTRSESGIVTHRKWCQQFYSYSTAS